MCRGKIFLVCKKIVMKDKNYPILILHSNFEISVHLISWLLSSKNTFGNLNTTIVWMQNIANVRVSQYIIDVTQSAFGHFYTGLHRFFLSKKKRLCSSFLCNFKTCDAPCLCSPLQFWLIWSFSMTILSSTSQPWALIV